MKSIIALSSLLFWLPLAAAEIQPLSESDAKTYQLDPTFYQKTLRSHDILIATSDRVADYTLRETAYQFDQIMSRLDAAVAERIRDAKVLCILVAHDELTSDVPQFKSDKTGKELAFYNWRQRGFLTRIDERMTVFFAEEDVMEYDGGMQDESILIHEFGHVIDFAGLSEDQRERVTQAYQQAMEKKRWHDARAAQRFRRVTGDQPVLLLNALTKSFPDQPAELLKKCLASGDILVNGKPTHPEVKVTEKDQVLIVFGGEKASYAAKNRGEYFAEGVQSWFDTNRTHDHDHNHIHTREQLVAYDSGLAKILSDIFDDSDWRFVSPRKRCGCGPLSGYDAFEAPNVEDPDFIRVAALDYYDEYWQPYWKRLHQKHGFDIEQ